MKSPVTDTDAAPSNAALDHFSRKFAFDTDCWDVHESMATGNMDFVLLDVRGPDDYRAGHLPGAINLPHRKIIGSKLAEWSSDTIFVVYCAGPHCNGADKAAVRLASLGRPVKLMMGGVTGWHDEGFPFASGDSPGKLLDAAE